MRPDSDSENSLIIALPPWINFLISILIILLVFMCVPNFLLLDKFDLIKLTASLLFLTPISVYLHETTHAKTYQLLTGNKAIIKWFWPSCKILEVTPISIFRIVLIAPISSVAIIGVASIILTLTNVSLGIRLGFATYTLIAAIGMGYDLYWFWILGKYSGNYMVIEGDKKLKVFCQ